MDYNPYENNDQYRHDAYGYDYTGNQTTYNAQPQKKKGNSWKRAFFILLAVAVIFVSGLTAYDLLKPNGSGTNAGGTPATSQQTGGNSFAPADSNSKTILELVQSSGEDLTPQEVAQKMIPSVVCIQNLSSDIKVASEGSGIIITSDGYIVTNAHVVSGEQSLKVILSNGESIDATLVGMDEATDLALVKINKTGLSPAEFADSESVEVGQFVMAVGNPGGLEFSSSVTMGIVSAKDRPLELSAGYTMKTIQTDAAINPGNSGGALVNMQGQVVGINSAKYAAEGFEGLGFAITTDEATPIINDLKENGYVTNRAMLGITSVFVEEERAKFYDMPAGMYVDQVTNPNAGTLRSGDMITTIDGKVIDSETVVRDVLNEKKPGDKVTLTFYRSSDNKTYTTELTLTEYKG